MKELNNNNVWDTGDPVGFDAVKTKTGTPEYAYTMWKQAPEDMNSKESLLKSLAPTIDSALQSYAPELKSSLKIQANLMALDAAHKYKPNSGTKLTSFVHNHLKGLNRVKAQRTNVVHIPENILLDKNKITKMEEAFKAENDREPSAAELADMSGLSIKRIEYIRTKGNIKSGSQLLTEKGDSLFSGYSDPQKLWADYVYHDLDGRDQKIFEWSTGYAGAPQLKKAEIAKRLKISAPAVSQRINRIIKLLEQGYNV